MGAKLKCSSYVLPVLLFGSVTWAPTQKQTDRLEVVHSDCFRQVLIVCPADRNSKQQ
jgi:hypothetical protein